MSSVSKWLCSHSFRCSPSSPLLGMMSFLILLVLCLLHIGYSSSSFMWFSSSSPVYSHNSLEKLDMESVSLPGSNRLLDLDNFQFTITADVCDSDKLYFVIMVHSKPDHFNRRALIRQTWGSVREIEGWRIKVVFLLGQVNEQPYINHRSKQLHFDEKRTFDIHSNELEDKTSNTTSQDVTMQDLIEEESHAFGDIIQGNFADTYRNLSYKHLMGYKWVHESCHNKPKFVIKADDDVFIEIYHLFYFVSAIYGESPKPSLICNVIPSGTTPQKAGKWLVSPSEFLTDTYPKYCSGSAYLITPSLIPNFLKASSSVPKFWIDDIYVTGMLREALGISPFYLNLRYTYNPIRAERWLNQGKMVPLPFLFVALEFSDGDWEQLAKKLWLKSMSIHKRI